MKSGYETIHWNVCMPPMEIPITAWTWDIPSARVSSSCSEFTMSRMLNSGNFMRGCNLLFDGEDELPSPSASTRMT